MENYFPVHSEPLSVTKNYLSLQYNNLFLKHSLYAFFYKIKLFLNII